MWLFEVENGGSGSDDLNMEILRDWCSAWAFGFIGTYACNLLGCWYIDQYCDVNDEYFFL